MKRTSGAREPPAEPETAALPATPPVPEAPALAPVPPLLLPPLAAEPLSDARLRVCPEFVPGVHPNAMVTHAMTKPGFLIRAILTDFCQATRERRLEYLG